jgi:hypothetical protein
LVDEKGCNVVVLTDFDVYALRIVLEQGPWIPGIAIEFENQIVGPKIQNKLCQFDVKEAIYRD